MRDASGGVAVYVMAHQMYLNGEYWSAYGMCKAALLMTNDVYPISMIYIRCMMAMCRINRKDMQESQSEFMKGWNLAKMDNFIEPFIEHHGLLRGLRRVSGRMIRMDTGRLQMESFFSAEAGW